MKSILKFFLNIAIYVGIFVGVLWGVPAGLSYLLHTSHPMASVTSGSMWPALKTGDLILIEGVTKQDLKKGDVVVWRNEGGFTIHRIVTLNDSTAVTKGDANFKEDEPVAYEDIIGRALLFHGSYARVPYVGYATILISRYIHNPNS